MAIHLKAHKRRGFTLVELLVVIGIIALLIAILLPVLNKARATALRVACASNVRQIVLMTLQYAQDNHGQFPTQPAWASPGNGGLAMAGVVGDWHGGPPGVTPAKDSFAAMWNMFITYGGLNSHDSSPYANPPFNLPPNLGAWVPINQGKGPYAGNGAGFWTGLGPLEMPPVLLCPANSGYGPTYRIGYSYLTGGTIKASGLPAMPMSIQMMVAAAKTARSAIDNNGIPGRNPTIWCCRLALTNFTGGGFNGTYNGGGMETWGHGAPGVSNNAGGNCGHLDGSVSWYSFPVLPANSVGNYAANLNAAETYVPVSGGMEGSGGSGVIGTNGPAFGTRDAVPCDSIFLFTDTNGANGGGALGAPTAAAPFNGYGGVEVGGGWNYTCNVFPTP